jgi:DNA-directed RNA polymerase subunit F
MAWAQTSAAVIPAETADKPSVLSFLEWKSMRVHEAQKKLEQVNKTEEQKLSFNVDVALQLTVQDYFSMYLKNLSPEEFKEAVKKLVPDESAELLMAYRNSLEKDKKVPLKFSKSPKDNATQKPPEI